MSGNSTAPDTDAGARRTLGASRSVVLWGFVAVGALLVGAALFSPTLRDLVAATFSSRAAVDAAGETKQAPSAASPGSEASPFGMEALRQVVSVLKKEERARVLGDEAAFAQLVKREHARHSVIRAAREAALDARPEMVYLMQRNAEQVLVDTYVQLGAGAAVAPEFPSDAQTREFYENNKARYTLEERVPVWQIFISLSQNATEGQIAEAADRLNAVVEALKSGKLTFAQAAAEGSDHEASRLDGGFMGNLKVSELIPEVKDVVLGAKPGEVVGPVRSQSGFHVLKRGDRIEAKAVPFDQVKGQIRNTLRSAAENRARQMVISRAEAQFGGEISQADLERWRKALVEAYEAPE